MVASNSARASLELSVDRFEAGGVPGDVRLPERESVLAGVGEPLRKAARARAGSVSAKARPYADSAQAIQNGLPWARAAARASSAMAMASSARPTSGNMHESSRTDRVT